MLLPSSNNTACLQAVAHSFFNGLLVAVNLPQFLPSDHPNAALFELRRNFGIGEDAAVGIPINVRPGHGLKFRTIDAAMQDDLRHPRLEILEPTQIDGLLDLEFGARSNRRQPKWVPSLPFY